MADHEKFNLKSLNDLMELSDKLGLDIPISENLGLLLQPLDVSGKTISNRLMVQPMEGFDSKPDGAPSELTFRRYERYAGGGSGMIWFEATSVMQEGRSNPQQLMLNRKTLDGFKRLVESIKETASRNPNLKSPPFLVLQLTHSGRYSKPGGKPSGKYFYENKYLDPDQKCNKQFTDDELEIIRDKYFEAIDLAGEAGFDSVDLKISHGYLLHEILMSFNKSDSKYGGTFDNRMSLIRQIVSYPTKLIRSIRLNITDVIPYPCGFGMKNDGSLVPDLAEPLKIIKEFEEDVPLWNITAGIPYFNPHVNRPYDKGLKGSKIPPEHPLEGVSRLVNLAGDIKLHHPDLAIVGSGYSWLRQFFPNVGAGVIEKNMASFIGMGRIAFAYPDAANDIINTGALNPKKLCICCSNCTQLMRNGTPTGCTVRDPEYYKL